MLSNNFNLEFHFFYVCLRAFVNSWETEFGAGLGNGMFSLFAADRTIRLSCSYVFIWSNFSFSWSRCISACSFSILFCSRFILSWLALVWILALVTRDWLKQIKLVRELTS